MTRNHGRPRWTAMAGSVLLLVVGLAVGPAAATGRQAPGAEGGATDWAQVSTGGYHTCAIRATGRLYCWGADAYGQLGDGGTNTDQPAPVQVAGGGTNWTAVSAGNEHTCARKATGRVFCWGSDASGQLGDGGGNTNQPAPVQVAGGVTNWSAVDAGRLHTCARKATGRVFCWGSDASGQLGDGGGNTNQPAPVQVFGGVTTWTAVNAGNDHTCARKTTGRLFCWGDDEYGQLGNGGPDTDAPAPAEVFGGATNWTGVNAGRLHTCARKTTGRLFCWGSDEAGQRGDGGANTDAPAPVQVFGGATNWSVVNASGSHTCAIKTTGRLYCWGFDGFGQLGDGSPDTNQPSPVQVA